MSALSQRLPGCPILHNSVGCLYPAAITPSTLKAKLSRSHGPAADGGQNQQPLAADRTELTSLFSCAGESLGIPLVCELREHRRDRRLRSPNCSLFGGKRKRRLRGSSRRASLLRYKSRHITLLLLISYAPLQFPISFFFTPKSSRFQISPLPADGFFYPDRRSEPRNRLRPG